MSLPVAILAGGLATRLRPVTSQIPKSLVEVAGKPFAVHQIELLRRNGLTDLIFCVGFLGDQVQAALGDGARWGVRLQYVFDGEKLGGTGGALVRALPLLGEMFLVLYGDSYLECDYAAVASAFLNSGKAGLMTIYRNEDLWDTSNVEYAAGRICQYDKINRTARMKHIDYGLGALRSSVLSAYPQETVIDLTQIYQGLVAQDQLAGFEVTQRFYEIGSPAGLAETDTHLRGKDNDDVFGTPSSRNKSDRRAARSGGD